MKTRWPSPAGSAILARHCSTSFREEVAPDARSADREASVGLLGIVIPSLVLALFVVVRGRNVEIEQRRAQRFAMRIERQRARHAATERLVHHEIQRGQIG